MRHVEQAVPHLGHHQVRVVGLGNRGHDVAILDAGLDQRLLVKAHTLHGGAVEGAAEVRERVGIAVDDAHVAAVVRKHVRQLRSYAAAADNDHVVHASPFIRRRAAPPMLCAIAYCICRTRCQRRHRTATIAKDAECSRLCCVRKRVPPSCAASAKKNGSRTTAAYARPRAQSARSSSFGRECL